MILNGPKKWTNDKIKVRNSKDGQVYFRVVALPCRFSVERVLSQADSRDFPIETYVPPSTAIDHHNRSDESHFDISVTLVDACNIVFIG